MGRSCWEVGGPFYSWVVFCLFGGRGCWQRLADVGAGEIPEANRARQEKSSIKGGGGRIVIGVDVFSREGSYFGLLAYLGTADVGEVWRKLAMSKYPTEIRRG